jgi:hypothetical protein
LNKKASFDELIPIRVDELIPITVDEPIPLDVSVLFSRPPLISLGIITTPLFRGLLLPPYFGDYYYPPISGIIPPPRRDIPYVHKNL